VAVQEQALLVVLVLVLLVFVQAMEMPRAAESMTSCS